ncbi:MAG: class I SAM-dependent methyltransferase [Gaiellaceae bacterium]
MVLPLPPPEMRNLVGPPEPERYDNPSGGLVFGHLPGEASESVLDFGCGCGRIARQLIQQHPQPKRYLGVDLHRGMIAWCQRNLTPCAPGFLFEHHDIYNLGFNPTGRHRVLPLPADDGQFMIFNATSVFTHCGQDQAEFYLGEAARILRPDGYLHADWFLFDKRLFPMMQRFQNALFINETDPSNAVIFDRNWLRETAAAAGLVITLAQAPSIRGFHWLIVMRPQVAGLSEVELPADDAPLGSRPPPLMPPGAERIGCEPRQPRGRRRRRRRALAGREGSLGRTPSARRERRRVRRPRPQGSTPRRRRLPRRRHDRANTRGLRSGARRPPATQRFTVR